MLKKPAVKTFLEKELNQYLLAIERTGSPRYKIKSVSSSLIPAQ
jgi:hypothetical protein